MLVHVCMQVTKAWTMLAPAQQQQVLDQIIAAR